MDQDLYVKGRNIYKYTHNTHISVIIIIIILPENLLVSRVFFRNLQAESLQVSI